MTLLYIYTLNNGQECLWIFSDSKVAMLSVDVVVVLVL